MAKISRYAAIGLGIGVTVSAQAALFQYNFINQPGDQLAQPPELVNSNITVSDLTRGPGLVPSNKVGIGNISSTQWTLNEIIDLNDYYEFTITPKAGAVMTLTGFSFWEKRQGTGPSTIELRTSMDGYTSSQIISTLAAANVKQQIVTLSPSETFAGLNASLTFRLYGYSSGQNNGEGDWALVNDSGAAGFVFEGAAIPEPTTLGLLGIGTVGLLLRRRKRS